MSTSNGDQFQRLLFVASCEVKIDPEFPARGSSAANRAFDGTAHELFTDDGDVPDVLDGLVAVVSNKQETV